MGPSSVTPDCFLPLQAGMPRTLTASDMVTPGSLSPPPTESTEGEQAGQPLLDGAPSSASLDTLIQHLVPTADYYPEVGEPPLPGTGKGQESAAQVAGLEMASCLGSRVRLVAYPLCADEFVWHPHQKAYIFTFLLSSRLFIEPGELLARVCHLCIEQQQLDKPVLDKVRSPLCVHRYPPQV